MNTQPINQQIQGPICSGKNALNTLYLATSDGIPVKGSTVVAEAYMNDWNPVEPAISRTKASANALVLAAGFNLLDKAGRELGIDAAKLGEINLAALIRLACHVRNGTYDSNGDVITLSAVQADKASDLLNALGV